MMSRNGKLKSIQEQASSHFFFAHCLSSIVTPSHGRSCLAVKTKSWYAAAQVSPRDPTPREICLQICQHANSVSAPWIPPFNGPTRPSQHSFSSSVFIHWAGRAIHWAGRAGPGWVVAGAGRVGQRLGADPRELPGYMRPSARDFCRFFPL